MQVAVHERLEDLRRCAGHLQALLESEPRDRPFAMFVLARLAIDTDETVGRLEQMAERLAAQVK